MKDNTNLLPSTTALQSDAVRRLLDNPDQIFDIHDVGEATKKDYKYRIRHFLQFVQQNGINNLTYRQYKQYWTERTDVSISTKNAYLTAAKVYLKELSLQLGIPDITQNTKFFQQDKKHKKDGLNDDEVTQLVSWMQQLPETPQSARIKAIISLLVLQGMRQIEVIRLDVSDIDLTRKKAFIQGKGRDDKEPINLHLETVAALQEYIKSNKKKSGALFTSISNNGKNKRLTTRSLRRIVVTILRDLSIDKSTHGLRHFFTTRLLKVLKGDALTVAQYTRHRSIAMLQIYNDEVIREKDLPKYYSAFGDISFTKN